MDYKKMWEELKDAVNDEVAMYAAFSTSSKEEQARKQQASYIQSMMNTLEKANIVK
ncbi:hypothetical protein RG959_00100 [Domibacillus sp. 8LH]|uniref:hypothetical protein n=1 Tax=Domibacillus TaxID=1433999 RepID=UPI001F5968D1|nr:MULTISPECIES: hypothetical protein [Domibacillus]MCI2253996.1 hypothetical protein [Domibacillus sp. PGB-M46]MCM3788063.1 hypothetical protein [Domibacillus indicus]WNS79188.1 hypothetical protein RRU94_16625 [Domibacillus sp. DTU_2020_1001157_1_SI_ALB_TIR_016]